MAMLILPCSSKSLSLSAVSLMLRLAQAEALASSAGASAVMLLASPSMTDRVALVADDAVAMNLGSAMIVASLSCDHRMMTTTCVACGGR